MTNSRIGVLLIEQQRREAELLIREALCPQDNFSVTHALDVAAAASAAATTSYDVVLLDVDSLDNRGLETLRRAREILGGLPIIVLTDHISSATALQAIRHGAEECLIKGRASNDSLIRCIRYARERNRLTQALRREEQKYRMLFDRNPDGVFSLDSRGRFVIVNPACEAISGYSRFELLGRSLTDLCAPECLPEAISAFESGVETRQTYSELEATVVRKDGRRVDLWIAGETVVEHDEVVAIHCTAKDITERKRAEDALRRSERELERRVRERTAELAQAVSTLQLRSSQLRKMTAEVTLAEQRERQCLAQILHDGLQQTLVGAKFRLASAARNEEVHRELGQVTDLIDDAIETSRSLSAELSPPILMQGDLASMLEWLVRWMHDKHKLEVKLSIPEETPALPEGEILLLFQATRELLFNIVKHAGVGSARIEVSQLDGDVILQVEDEGAGFDPTQLGAEGGQAGGIGLFGIKERITYIGGQLQITSSPGQGSRFRLIAPVAPASMKTNAPGAGTLSPVSVPFSTHVGQSETRSREKVRIMLVDDHMVVRQGLAGLIRGEEDLEVAGEASDGESAVKLARELWPNIILMDISMPGMDGIQATRIIHQEFPDIGIIGLSMFQDEEQKAAMCEAGAMTYFTKSGPSEALIEIIRTCVKKGSAGFLSMWCTRSLSEY